MIKKTLAGIVLGSAALLPAHLYAQDEEPAEQTADVLRNNAVPANIENSVVCLRNTTIRQKPAYDSEGRVIFLRDSDECFGTGFIYMEKDNHYYIVTNHHISCGDELDNGRKRVRDIVEIVSSINDTNPKDDIRLTFVASSPARDIAVLKIEKKVVQQYNENFDLEIEPYTGAWGDSDALQKGQTIVIEGFPYALLKATTEGAVSNPRYEHMNNGFGWRHQCVVYDAATNPGNSGSPAFRKNPDGSFEWMGNVHAGYRAEGMKMFIAINEYKELLTTFRTDRQKERRIDITEQTLTQLSDRVSLDASENLFTILEGEEQGIFSFFNDPFEKLYCMITKTGESLEFIIYTRNFPLDTTTRIKLIDRKENSYGCLDELGVLDREYGCFLFEKSRLSPELGSQANSMLKYLAELALKSAEYKTLQKQGQQELMDGVLIDIEVMQKDKARLVTEFKNNLQIFLKEQYFEREKAKAGK